MNLDMIAVDTTIILKTNFCLVYPCNLVNISKFLILRERLMLSTYRYSRNGEES